MVEEEHFNVSLPQILEMVFLDVHIYIAVFWAGDEEFSDKEAINCLPNILAEPGPEPHQFPCWNRSRSRIKIYIFIISNC
jgi:hypothetical protein